MALVNRRIQLRWTAKGQFWYLKLVPALEDVLEAGFEVVAEANGGLGPQRRHLALQTLHLRKEEM